jgi:hypothetical protein
VAAKVAEVQNMARHVLRNALVLWLSGQHLNRQLGRGDEGNRQSEMANPTKCRDSLQVALVAAPRAVPSHPTVTAPGGSSKSTASATVPCLSQSGRRQASTQGKETAKVLFYQHFGRIVGALVLFHGPNIP